MDGKPPMNSGIVAQMNFRSDKQVNDILDDYADHLGIMRRAHLDEPEPLWDTETIPLFDDPRDTAHEVAHWVLHSDKQKAMVNYGWNFDWQYHGTYDKHPDAPPTGSEYQACVLGFSMMIRAGMENCHEVYDEYQFVSPFGLEPWVSTHRREVQSQVADFQSWLDGRER